MTTTKRFDPSYGNIRTMLRDAIVEYIANRADGDVNAYMAERYPNLYGAAHDEKKQSVTSAIYHAKKAINHLDAITEFVVTKFDEDYNRAIEAHEAAHKAVEPKQEPKRVMFFDDITPTAQEIDAMYKIARAMQPKSDVMRKVAEANNIPVVDMQKADEAQVPVVGYWMTVPVPMTRKQVRKYLGKRCNIYEKGCGCCDGWKAWEQTGELPVLIDRATLIKQLMKGKL